MGMRIRELERLYGIEYGGDRKSSSNKYNLKTQEDIAKEMGISIPTLQNYKLLSDMIPELSDLVDTGIVTKTTAITQYLDLYDLLTQYVVELSLELC